jgi:hypothetical protein
LRESADSTHGRECGGDEVLNEFHGVYRVVGWINGLSACVHQAWGLPPRLRPDTHLHA